MKTNRLATVVLSIFLVLFLISSIMAVTASLFDLSLISFIGFVSILLFLIITIKNFPPNKQNAYGAVCFFLLALAELIVFFHDSYADKSRLGFVGIFIAWGIVMLTRARKLKSE